MLQTSKSRELRLELSITGVLIGIFLLFLFGSPPNLSIMS